MALKCVKLKRIDFYLFGFFFTNICSVCIVKQLYFSLGNSIIYDYVFVHLWIQ